MSRTVRRFRRSGGTPGGIGRLVWWWCLVAAAVLGTLAMLDRWGVAALIVFVAFGALLAAVVAANIWSGDDVPRAGRKIVVTTLCGALLGPAAAGLFSVFGTTALLIILSVAATSPGVVRFARTHWFATGDEQPSAQPTEQSTEQSTEDVAQASGGHSDDEPAGQRRTGLEQLNDQALCLAWRRSYFQLEAAATPAERLRVVEQRQRYLDELQRRSPHGVAAWLAAGARASGDPLPYVADNHRRID